MCGLPNQLKAVSDDNVALQARVNKTDVESRALQQSTAVEVEGLRAQLKRCESQWRARLENAEGNQRKAAGDCTMQRTHTQTHERGCLSVRLCGRVGACWREEEGCKGKRGTQVSIAMPDQTNTNNTNCLCSGNGCCDAATAATHRNAFGREALGVCKAGAAAAKREANE